MKKILGLTIAAILVIGAVGAGTWALWSDTETSTDNILTAGTIDLKTNDADGVSGTFTATAMKPGDIVASVPLNLTNVGSIDGTTLDITFAYSEQDGGGSTEDAVNLTPDEFAAGLTITALSYDGNSLIPSITDANGNGRVDMHDLSQSVALQGLPGIAADLTSKAFAIQVQLDPAAGNEFQNDGIDVTVTFILNQ